MEKLLNWIIIISVCIIGYALFFTPKQEVSYASTEDTTFQKWADPMQTAYHGSDIIPIRAGGLDLKLYPKANYQIYAMVMSKKNYMFGWESKISPYDLALGWDKLMLAENRKGISYSQNGRWYYYRYDGGYPLPNSYIRTHSSNHHIIPASDEVKKTISRVRTGDKVFLEGYLVYIKGKVDGRDVWWNSSLTRNDSGNGACEVFYVTDAIVD